jgi:hypothetical protein
MGAVSKFVDDVSASAPKSIRCVGGWGLSESMYVLCNLKPILCIPI